MQSFSFLFCYFCIRNECICNEPKPPPMLTQSVKLKVKKSKMKVLENFLKETGVAVIVPSGENAVVKGKAKKGERPGGFLESGGPVKMKFDTFQELRESAWREKR